MRGQSRIQDLAGLGNHLALRQSQINTSTERRHIAMQAALHQPVRGTLPAQLAVQPPMTANHSRNGDRRGECRGGSDRTNEHGTHLSSGKGRSQDPGQGWY